jgi:signal transduction histidine kinase
MKQFCTILLIRRSQFDTPLFQRSLSQSPDVDWNIVVADSGKAALDICCQTAPDAILMDSDLPDMESEHFISKLKQFEETLPIVAIAPTLPIAVQLLEAGAKDYILSQSVTPEVLQHTMQSVILRRIIERNRKDRLNQQLKQSQIALRRAIAQREEAETENQNKDEFLAIVTHELRTPLNAILGWAKLLRSRNLDSESIDRALETIERNAQSQSHLIEDLLDISRIIRGQLLLKEMTVNLYAVISAAIEGVRPTAAAKNIQLEFSSMDLDLVISGDPKRLQQIVLNLLTNAIKFTPEGGQVTVQLTELDETAQVKVIDTGIGIQPDFLPHVFDRFRQDETNAASAEGLGLGLTIVHQLVELHRGSITVESEGSDRGTTFIVQFPLASLKL